MKRLGIRKAATAVFNSKIGQGIDKGMNAIVTAPGTIAKKVGIEKVTSKLKVDVSGKAKRKNANQSINDKIMLANQKLVMQDAKDLAEAKAFEREQADNLAELDIEMNVDIKNFASTRIPEEKA